MIFSENRRPLFRIMLWKLLKTGVEARGARRPRIRLFVMLAQIGVQRIRAGLGEQRLEHHVLAAAVGEMLAIGLAQRTDAGVAVLPVDAARRIAMPAVQALSGHLTLPTFSTCEPSTVPARRVVGGGRRRPRRIEHCTS